MLLCGECGYVPQCPRCSVPMTYHSANERLMCHYCGHSEAVVDRCSECGGLMKRVGSGTQKVEQELFDLFPKAKVLRMDADTVGASRGHEALLREFEEKNIPILLGTQMVAKGLDFENVTLVGVLSADISLYVDNYRAAERTFSLLTQVVGRAGRGGSAGRAVIQTYTPRNDVILAAAEQDYDRFYDDEIRLRRLRRDPPFADHFTLTVTGMAEGSTVTYESSEPAVATVDGTGKVTIKGAGTAIITAKASATEDYDEAAVTCTLTVEKKPITAPAADATVFTYNGTEQTYALAEDGAYTITGNKQTNANEMGYSVTAALKDTANTQWADGTTANKTYTFVIGKAVINTDWCLAYKLIGCRFCYDACPYEAMELDENNRPVVIEDKCNGCGACESVCVSLQNGSISEGATARAIVVHPLEEVEG